MITCQLVMLHSHACKEILMLCIQESKLGMLLTVVESAGEVERTQAVAARGAQRQCCQPCLRLLPVHSANVKAG